jgi:hypothetical protein
VGGAPSASVAAFAGGFAGLNFDLPLPVSLVTAAAASSNTSIATGGIKRWRGLREGMREESCKRNNNSLDK